jgi:hypothetical protein
MTGWGRRVGSGALVALALLLAAGAAGTQAKEGAPCGGIAGAECSAGEYCAYLPGMCPGDVMDASGVCRQKVEVCPELYAPVCGCDSRTYSSECHAAAARTSVNHAGECKAK